MGHPELTALQPQAPPYSCLWFFSFPAVLFSQKSTACDKGSELGIIGRSTVGLEQHYWRALGCIVPADPGTELSGPGLQDRKGSVCTAVPCTGSSLLLQMEGLVVLGLPTPTVTQSW